MEYETDSVPGPRAHFFTLPRELRDAIYEQCLPSSPSIIRVDEYEFPEWLLTSRQIFFEAAGVVYGQTCLYQQDDLRDTRDLVFKLCQSYLLSAAGTHFSLVQRTFPYLKGFITSIAIDVELEIGNDELGMLGDYYFRRLGELTGLRKLYLCLSPRGGRNWDKFRREIQMSDLRIFHITHLMRAVERLHEIVPSSCEIVWRIPDSIRRKAEAATLTKLLYCRDVEKLMEERDVALNATKPGCD